MGSSYWAEQCATLRPQAAGNDFDDFVRGKEPFVIDGALDAGKASADFFKGVLDDEDFRSRTPTCSPVPSAGEAPRGGASPAFDATPSHGRGRQPWTWRQPWTFRMSASPCPPPEQIAATP